MKRSIEIIVAVAITMMFFSCSMNTSNSNIKKPSVGSIMPGAYTDVTSLSMDARKISKDAFLETVDGVYRNGDSFIKIDSESGRVELYTPSAYITGSSGSHSFRALYDLALGAAARNCIYMKQANRSTMQIEIDGESKNGLGVNDLLLCVPLYGYGENRLEVSSIMNGFSAMPSGTYIK